MSDTTKWDGPTHICIDNKIHIGKRERCSSCAERDQEISFDVLDAIDGGEARDSDSAGDSRG